VEFLVNNYALIPPSRHPTGVLYEWIRPFKLEELNLGVRALVDSEVESLLEELGLLRARSAESETLAEKTPREGLRKLSDSDMLRVKELLREAYRPGSRQFIWLFLSGWAAKAGVDPISVAKILKMLYEETGDTDPLKTRASAIVYSYKKAGVDLAPYASQFEELFGVKPYGLEREISEEEVKGKTGLQEILEEVLGEEGALGVIEEIEEIFRASSPFRDSIIERLDYEKQLYAVANLRKLVVVRARRESSKLVYKERVFVGAPTGVEVYVNPIGGVTKYRVKWEAATRPKPIEIGPALLGEILERLKAEGLVLNSRLAEDVLAAIIEGFIRRGKATIRTEIESPGFYIIEGKLQPVRVDVKEPSTGELKEALLLLNELATNWFKHVLDRFVFVVKWGLVAPFIYAYKQRGKWVKWPYLYGPSRTGKTTLGEVVLAMWGLDSRHIKSGANIDTPPRLGHVLSQSTFPVLVNEPGGALSREDIVEMIKAAVESKVARGRFYRSSYADIPALAPLIFTSNKYLPRDDALLRRLEVLRFTIGERIPEDRAREFESRVKPELKKLKAIGDFATSYFTEKGLGEDLLAQSVAVLKAAYESVGLETPSWVYLEHTSESEAELYEDLREAIRSHLVKRINEEYSRFVGRVVVVREETSSSETYSRSELGLEERARVVLEKQLIPWLVLIGSEVYITKGILEELKDTIGDTTLKSLAELLGWEYKSRHSIRQGDSVTSKSVIRVSLESFLEFLKLQFTEYS
jgi:hypothetical protein